jgi:rod shape-determining protein MreC
VFAVDADPYRRIFQIDRGTREGVQTGQAIVVGRALLGVAIDAKPNFTTIRRIDDPSFLIEVEIETADGVLSGIAQGDADRGLEVRFVRQTSALREGDAVFTSRYDAKVPPGLLVGRVAAIRDIDQDGMHEVSVAPAAMAGRWAQVEVLEAVALPR